MAEDLGDSVGAMLEGLAMSERSMRCSIIWAGEEYPVTGGPELGGKRMDEGGFRLSSNVKIKLRTVLLNPGSGRPQEKQTILYKRSANSEPKKYRIDAITNYYDAFLLLECNDPAQGA